MSVIELTPKNYKEYFPTNLLACTYAYSGAMGEGGRIQFMDKKGNLYHLNYCRGPHKWNDTILNEMFPFDQCLNGVFDNIESPKSWKSYSMGAGNFLYIHNSIINTFEERKPEIDCYLYRDWEGIVKSIVEENMNQRGRLICRIINKFFSCFGLEHRLHALL